MRSSLFRKLKLRLLDGVLDRLGRPNRIDVDAEVSPLAQVSGSRLHGPVRVGPYARLHQVLISGPVTIGQNSSLWGPRIYVLARREPVTIGNFCSIARDVSIHGYGHDHRRISTHYIGRNVLGLPFEEEFTVDGPTDIGHDVWIGAGVHVLSGVTIGTGAVIGAGSVVSRDVPPYAIAVGSPAAPVGYRFDEALIESLLQSRWWTWTPDQIRAKAPLFTQPLTPELLDEFLGDNR
jgi:acetyltransferase-like isoleucine patch superfamily enzyme